MRATLLLWIGMALATAVPCSGGWSLFNSSVSPATMIVTDTGRLWGITVDYDLFCGTRGDWQIYRMDCPPLRSISGATEEQLLAVGDAGTVRRFQGGQWSELDLGLTEDVKFGLIDGQGAIWLAGDNLYRYAYDQLEQLPYSDIHLLALDRDGRVWIGTGEWWQVHYYQDYEFHDAPPVRSLVIGGDGRAYSTVVDNYHFCVWNGAGWELCATLPDGTLPTSMDFVVSRFCFNVLAGGQIWAYYGASYTPPHSPVTYWNHFIVKIDGDQCGVGTVPEQIQKIIPLSSGGLLIMAPYLFWDTGEDGGWEVPFSRNMSWIDVEDWPNSCSGVVYTQAGRLWASQSYYRSAYGSIDHTLWRIDWPWRCSQAVGIVLDAVMELDADCLLAVSADSFSAGSQRLQHLHRYSPESGWRRDDLPLPDRIQGCALAGADDQLFWVGGRGIYRCEQGEWEEEVDARPNGELVRCMLRLPDGSIVAAGDCGFFMRRTPSGSWASLGAESTVDFTGLAWSEPDQKVWAVGTNRPLYEDPAGYICAWTAAGGMARVELPWTTGPLTTVLIAGNNRVYTAGEDHWVYGQTRNGWERQFVGSNLQKWLGQMHGLLFLMDRSFLLWTNLDAFAPVAGAARVSLGSIPAVYRGGEELAWTVAAAPDSSWHEVFLHAFLMVEDEVFYYPNWNGENTGAPVVFGPGEPLSFELVRASLPDELPDLQAQLWVYLSDTAGQLVGNTASWHFHCQP